MYVNGFRAIPNIENNLFLTRIQFDINLSAIRPFRLPYYTVDTYIKHTNLLHIDSDIYRPRFLLLV